MPQWLGEKVGHSLLLSWSDYGEWPLHGSYPIQLFYWVS